MGKEEDSNNSIPIHVTWRSRTQRYERHFPYMNKMKEKMRNVAYSYWTMLVSSNLKLPHHRHIGPRLPFPAAQHAMQSRHRKAVVIQKRKQHEASSTGARLIGYMSLP